MKKIYLALMCIAALTLTACGGKSGGSSSGGDSDNGGGLPDGKWPAAVYDKYDIPEIETKGKIVCTEFDDNSESYQYRVYYNGVTKEEMQAWVKKLQEKGFRVPSYTQERIDNGHRDSDAFLYQPGEQKDKCLRMTFDFDTPMSFEYYDDEPNPAFTVVERDGKRYLDYNFTVSLCTLKSQPDIDGSIEALDLKASDFAGIPGIRVISLSNGQMGAGMNFSWYADHQLTKESFEAVHKKVLDVLASKGCTFKHAFSGKDMTAEELSAQGIHSYGVKLNDQQFTMMTICDERVGDFGGSIKFMFAKSRK